MLAFLLLIRSAISKSSERFGSCNDGSHARSVGEYIWKCQHLRVCMAGGPAVV